MKMQTSLKTIAGVSVAGLLFSGYLSYQELFGPASQTEGVSCGEAAFSIPGPPVCVYGFAMYAIILVLSLLGLNGGRSWKP